MSDRASDKVSNGLVVAGAVGLLTMTLVIAWQVIGRFILNASPSWSEQGAMVLMIWYVMLTAAAGVREGFHIRIALLEEHAPPGVARLARLAIHAVVAVLGLSLFFYGGQLVWLVRDHVIPSLSLSRGFAYLPLPIAGVLMTWFALGHFVNDWRGTAPSDAAEN